MRVIAIHSPLSNLDQLAHSFAFASKVVSIPGRIFLYIEETFLPNQMSERIAEVKSILLHFKIDGAMVASGSTASRALVRALSQVDCEDLWPIQYIFDFLAPFRDSKIDLRMQISIMDWFSLRDATNFSDFQKLRKSNWPTPLKFFAELFDEANKIAPSSSEAPPRLENLMVRIRKRLGSEHVFSACSQQTLLLVPRRDRPSRLLPVPIPISHFDNRILSPNQKWNCSHWSDPERIAGFEWNQIFDREYFTVNTKEGDVLWIFRDLLNGHLYWHGLFD